MVWTQIVYDADRLGEWADLSAPPESSSARTCSSGSSRSGPRTRSMDGLFGVHVPSTAFDLLESAGRTRARRVEFTLSVVEKIARSRGSPGST